MKNKIYFETSVEFNLDDFNEMLEDLEGESHKKVIFNLFDILFRQLARRDKASEYDKSINKIIKISEKYLTYD